MKTFFDVTTKKGLDVVFSKCWAPFFDVKQRGRHFCSDFRDFAQSVKILPRFSGILPGFSANQNFWGHACTPFTPTSYTTDLRGR